MEYFNKNKIWLLNIAKIKQVIPAPELEQQGIGDKEQRGAGPIHRRATGLSGENPGVQELSTIALAHVHAEDWDHFLAAYRIRLEKGSYRADLGPERPRDKGGMTLHELFRQIEAEDGEAGLRAFFHEVCAATPRLTAALRSEGLLRRVDLQLDAHIREHFPDYA